MSIGEAAAAAEHPEPRADSRLWPITGYVLRLGTVGFGGPAALVGHIHRDLVERRRWVDEDTFRLALGLAQIMPGPLAAQAAIAIGYFQAGVPGATLAALGIFLPVYVVTIIPAPWFKRHQNNAQLKAFVQGATAAPDAATRINPTDRSFERPRAG